MESTVSASFFVCTYRLPQFRSIQLQLFLHHFLYVHTDVQLISNRLFHCFYIIFCMYIQTYPLKPRIRTNCFCIIFCMYIQMPMPSYKRRANCFCIIFCMYIQSVFDNSLVKCSLCVMFSCGKHYRKGETDSAQPLGIAENASICCPLLGLQITFFNCGCLILTGEFTCQSFVFSLYS